MGWQVLGAEGSPCPESAHRGLQENRKCLGVLRNKKPLGGRGQIQEGQVLLPDYSEEFSVKAVGSGYYPSSGGCSKYLTHGTNTSPSQSEETAA